MIVVQEMLRFKENISGNTVEKAPGYMKGLFEDEYSPIRKYLETVEPNCLIRAMVVVEVRHADR
jgi:hypothetical protein